MSKEEIRKALAASGSGLMNIFINENKTMSVSCENAYLGDDYIGFVVDGKVVLKIDLKYIKNVTNWTIELFIEKETAQEVPVQEQSKEIVITLKIGEESFITQIIEGINRVQRQKYPTILNL